MANIENVLKDSAEREIPVNPDANIGPEPDDKFFAAIGYFGPLFIAPLIVKPKSEYCKFHAKQSIALFILMLLVFVVLYMIPGLGSLLTLGLFVLYVLAIYKAFNGELWAIPLLSKFAGKIDAEKLYQKAGLAISTISGMKESASSASADTPAQSAGASSSSASADTPAQSAGASSSSASAESAPVTPTAQTQAPTPPAQNTPPKP